MKKSTTVQTTIRSTQNWKIMEKKKHKKPLGAKKKKLFFKVSRKMY